MSNYLNAAELRAVANIIDALDKADTTEIGFDAIITICDVNGEEVGSIKSSEAGNPFFYPKSEEKA